MIVEFWSFSDLLNIFKQNLIPAMAIIVFFIVYFVSDFLIKKAVEKWRK